MPLAEMARTGFSRLPVWLVILAIGLPTIASIWFGISAGGGSTWDHILQNRLLPYTLNTLSVLIMTAMLILVFALPTAWLISLYEFPGRKLFEWALILPLAVPGYVMAYAWADLAGVAGPVQSILRDMTGWSARDYWFPDIFTAAGLSFILASTLFPYVYITARAAFSSQSLAQLEAAKGLGVSGLRLFWFVALPTARLAITAGLALALMEAAADYGAADFLGIQTLGVGIVRSWSSYGEPASAARLALVLISIAFLFLLIARLAQGKAGTQRTSKRWLSPTRSELSRKTGWLATSLCTAILLVAFFLPVARLVWLLLEQGRGTAPLLPPLMSSLILGAGGTLLALCCALIISLWSARLSRLNRLGRLVMTAGYAVPGVVLGLGGLFVLKATGQALTGFVAIGLLIWVYATRFTAAGTEPLAAAKAAAPKSLDEATRSLGASRLRKFFTVDLPLVRPGILAASLILFVETIKELPATLMLSPNGWDTLAVRAHAYATDERLAEATLPSLLITLAGLIPVLILSWRLSKSGYTVE